MTDIAQTKSILFVFASAPQERTAARDGIDTLLAYAAFEQPVAVLFLGEGVWQLCAQQRPELMGKKSLYKALTALPMYDVTQIFIHNSSLDQRGLSRMQSSIENAQYIDDDEMRVLLRQYAVVWRF